MHILLIWKFIFATFCGRRNNRIAIARKKKKNIVQKKLHKKYFEKSVEYTKHVQVIVITTLNF